MEVDSRTPAHSGGPASSPGPSGVGPLSGRGGVRILDFTVLEFCVLVNCGVGAHPEFEEGGRAMDNDPSIECLFRFLYFLLPPSTPRPAWQDRDNITFNTA